MPNFHLIILKMNGLAIVEKGTEQVMADELHTLFNATKVAVLQTAVSFNVDKIEDLIRIIYKTRTAKKILLEFGKFNADNKLDSTLKKIKKLVEKTAFKKWITSVDSFRVRCLRKGKHNFVRNDIEREVGALIIEVLGKKQCPKVIMRNSDLTVFIYIIENKGWFGIDMTGKDLSKRDYRVFNYPRSLKGNIAYTALKLGGYKPGELLVDPFSGSGTIPIEAALWCTNKAPNFRIEEFGDCRRQGP